jgi:gliding motility-associated lipoprotein GldH
MILKKSSLILLLVFSVCFISCDKNKVFDEYKETKGIWKKTDVIAFNFEQKDTVKPYNLFLNIRNNNKYPFNNLYLIVKLTQPDSLSKIDTLQYAMTKPDGSLLGSGFSDVKESKLWYQENFVFKKTGAYKLEIQQALRETGSISGIDELPGVTEIGFRIEKTK